jgi:hypothetical protein
MMLEDPCLITIHYLSKRLGFSSYFADRSEFFSSFLIATENFSMLGGSLVTTAWRVHRLQMEETPSSFGG